MQEREHFSPGRSVKERKEHIANVLQESTHPDFMHFRPNILGEGSRRTVFDIARNRNEERRGVVVKIDRGMYEVAVRDVLRTQLGEVSSSLREAFSRRLTQERCAIKVFHKSFEGFVLPEKCFLRKVPCSPSIIREFFPEISFSEQSILPHEIPSMVYIQERAPDAAFGDHAHQMMFGCSERNTQYHDDTLFRANSAFIDLHEPWNSTTHFPGLSPDICRILREMREDVSLRGIMQEFIRCAYAYTEQTGDVLDLFGTDNGKLYKDAHGAWHLVLLDAYASGRIFAQAKEALRALLFGYEITDNETLAILHSINYTRNMNALALVSNTPERFKLSSSDVAQTLHRLLPRMRRQLSAIR